DHGESLGAHGESMHGIFLYDETIHVPLLFKLPGSLLAGKRVTTRVRLIDVAPTLLSMLSLPLPPTFQGESLVPEMKSSAKASRDLPAYAETEYPHRAFGWAGIRSMRTGKYLYIRAPKRELYDQTVDKKSDHNLASSSPAVTDTLGSQLDKFYDDTTSFHGKPQQNTTTAEQNENLAALGYVSSSAVGQSQDPLQGADPKDKIEISNILHEGMIAVEDGHYNEAIPMLQHVLADSPAITAAQLQLGIALARTKRYNEAIPALKKAIELVPDAVQAKYELALALYDTGAWNESVPYFEDVAKKRPKWVDAQYSLASVYARTKRVEQAVELLNKVLEISPDHFRANLLLGRIIYLQGDPAAALLRLEKATQIAPNSGEAHSFLADAYSQLGRDTDATRERERSKSLPR
ncbi:MAG TPA: tetratricopeptide repeat protein, partial [Terriglobales bacterium]|nr:tetratricopeptide repeat protein [Terriglobales bacterium]